MLLALKTDERGHEPKEIRQPQEGRKGKEMEKEKADTSIAQGDPLILLTAVLSQYIVVLRQKRKQNS